MKRRSVYAAVIGGGASGLMCALRAAQKHPGEAILILEKADRVGKKLLVTGNGRCNLSHLGADASSYHGEDSEELINILYKKYNPDAVLNYFHSLGLMTAADSEGRVYPRSNLASSVLDVLRSRLNACGVEEQCGADILGLRTTRGGFEIILGDELIAARKLVIAVGGKADYAGRESGAELIRTLGVSTVKPSPSLSPVKVTDDCLRSLKGVRASAEARLLHREKVVKTERGEVQFTDGALSGICIFNLSRYANRCDGCEIALSLLPELSADEVITELKMRTELNRNGVLSDLFTGLFHKNIGIAIIKAAGLRPSSPCSDISDTELKRLAERINDWRFTTVPRHDFKNAQVTAGGVRLSEIDPHTFGCRAHKGLYIIGEALDIDGDCGGYNLQFAFASGMCAGDFL